MTYKYSATLEFDEAKPETIKGSIDRKSHPSAFRDVMKLLMRAHPGRKPASIVICMLEIIRPSKSASISERAS